MISITTLLAPVTATQARASAVSQLVNMGIPADKWRVGGTFSTMLTVLCVLFAGFTVILTSALNSIFLGTASGSWLVALAYYVYGVTAQSATYGTGPVLLTNEEGGVYDFAPGQVVMQDTNTGNTFTNQDAISLGAGTPTDPTTQTVTFVAQVAGSIGGCAASAPLVLVTDMQGVTPTLAQAIIGVDAWTDPQVVAACYASMAARSQKGPTGAYYAAIYGYANIPGAVNSVTGLPVNINRISVVNDPDTGIIRVWLAAPGGIPDPNDVIGCQIAVTAVARPMGITATALACTVATYASTLTIWSTSSGQQAATTIQAAALLALDAAIAGYPIGGRPKAPSTQGYLYPSYLTGKCQVDPSIYAVDAASWAPLALSEGEVASLTSTVVVRQAAA